MFNVKNCICKLILIMSFLLALCANCYGQEKTILQESSYKEFAKVYGVVRYFSPNPYTEKWSEEDWMKVCTFLVKNLEKNNIESVFKPLAPTMYISEQSGIKNFKQQEDAYYYRYNGSGNLYVPFFAKIIYPDLSKYIPYYSSLVKADTDDPTAPIAGKYYSYPIAPHKYLHIQHATTEKTFDKPAVKELLDEAKTYWNTHTCNNTQISESRKFIYGLFSDKNYRIADIIVRWNIIRHFYPYYEYDNLDWENHLNDALNKAVNTPDIKSLEGVYGWYYSICSFMNPVKDAHTVVFTDMSTPGIATRYLQEYYAPVVPLYINDTVLIRDMRQNRDNTCAVLDSIDNVPAVEKIKQLSNLCNAATDAYRNNLAARKLFSSATINTAFPVVIRDSKGNSRRDTLFAQQADAPKVKRNGTAFKKLDSGVLYVDATSQSLDERSFLKAVTPDVRAICFDLRGYPTYKFQDILSHLIAENVKALENQVPISCFPFQQNITFRNSAEILSAKKPYIKIPITFLCDETTLSWGETILMMVRHYNLGKIVGHRTAGTTGDMTRFNLPIFPFSMTGMKMTNMDGSQHHAIGVIPDVEITVYAKDYLNGFDRILSTAYNIDCQAQHAF